MPERVEDACRCQQCAELAHRCTTLVQVLGGLVRAVDDLLDLGLIEMPLPNVSETALRHLDAPLAWHVLRYQLQEARELVDREREEQDA